MQRLYRDIFTDDVLSALSSMAHFNKQINEAMTSRMMRRKHRQKQNERITFLNPENFIPHTEIKVQDAREGKFEGSVIPSDLQRQWIQGTGPASKPDGEVENSIRNVAYALLSGADGWMFDGEDALGQINAMSFDNQRNLKLAIHKDPVFMNVASQVAKEMNKWAEIFFGYKIIKDWESQLNFTTKIFRVRGLHLADRHICENEGGANGSIYR